MRQNSLVNCCLYIYVYLSDDRDMRPVVCVIVMPLEHDLSVYIFHIYIMYIGPYHVSKAMS